MYASGGEQEQDRWCRSNLNIRGEESGKDLSLRFYVLQHLHLQVEKLRLGEVT